MAKVSGVALAAVMGCGLAGEAQAYQFEFTGRITGVTDTANLAPGLFVSGEFIRILFSGTSVSAKSTPGGTDLSQSVGGAQIATYNVAAGFDDVYQDPSFTSNDGITSSLYLAFGTTGQFYSNGRQSVGGRDGYINVSVGSALPNIPLNPDQSFGPVKVGGSGSFLTNSVYGYDQYGTPLYAGEFGARFDIVSVEGIGLTPVPLPASAPTFGAALLGLAGLGCAAKRKRAA